MPEWSYPVIAGVLLTVGGYFGRMWLKSVVGKVEDRLTRIDGGTEAKKGKLYEKATKFFVDKLEERLKKCEDAHEEAYKELEGSAEDISEEVAGLAKELSSLRESLPKEYVLKPDCLAERGSIEKYLTDLTRKVDRLLEKLANLRGGR